MHTHAEKGTENKSRAIANHAGAARPAPAGGTVGSRMPPERSAVQPGVIQRVIVVEESVEPADTRIIDIVLNANPVLRAVWDWLSNHARYTFTIVRADGFNRVNARLGEIDVSFTINPLTTNEEGVKVRNDPRWVSTVSHELTLHLLPWARIMMFHELAGDLGYSEAGDPAQLNRMRIVLGPIAGNTQTLAKEINADKDNKLTTSMGGNHSDIMLWNLHLRDVLNVVATQANTNTKGIIIASTLEKMRMPILLTGKVEDAVDRGPGALVQFNQAMTAVEALSVHVAEGQRDRFNENAIAIRARMAEYEHFLQVKRRVLALFPGQEIDMHLLNHAVNTGEDVEDAVFLYEDIKNSMN
jgi:hypothetical protein